MRPLSACTACRERRKRCNRSRPGVSCDSCIRRGVECIAVADPVTVAPRTSAKDYEPLDNRLEAGRPRQVSAFLVPDAALSDELVELYFRHAHVAFHNLFHQPTLITCVRESSIPKILFFGLASLSARYSTNPVFASLTPWDRGRPYQEETKRLLNLENVSLTSIQACMLLAASASVEGDPKSESVYHAIASRMAMLLDLPNIPTESLLEQEINRRVWWSIITTETWASATMSLPRLFNPRDKVPLPMDERRFLALDYAVSTQAVDASLREDSVAEDPSESIIAQMISLNALLYDVVVLNTRLVKDHSREEDSQGRTHELAHALDQWGCNLSPRLQHSDENVAYWVDQGLGPVFITLHINYNYAGQLLFYRYLHVAQNVEEATHLTDAAQTFAQRCKQHATNLCDLIYRAKDRPETVVMYPLAGHILCLASTVQIHILLFSDDDDQILAAKARLERNFDMISSMNHFWPMSHQSIRRLQIFHRTCLRSKDDSFQMDAWMLRFLLGFTQDIGDRDEANSFPGQDSLRAFDHLSNLLDI